MTASWSRELDPNRAACVPTGAGSSVQRLEQPGGDRQLGRGIDRLLASPSSIPELRRLSRTRLCMASCRRLASTPRSQGPSMDRTGSLKAAFRDYDRNPPADMLMLQDAWLGSGRRRNGRSGHLTSYGQPCAAGSERPRCHRRQQQNEQWQYGRTTGKQTPGRPSDHPTSPSHPFGPTVRSWIRRSSATTRGSLPADLTSGMDPARSNLPVLVPRPQLRRPGRRDDDLVTTERLAEREREHST
jgi:hypothetical protein